MRRIGTIEIITFVGCSGLSLGCGQKPAEAPVEQASEGGERSYDEPDEPLQISGIKGTLSQDEVQNALEPRMLKFARCVQKRSDAVEWLAGAMTLEFQVRVDGSVAGVYPKESSMGDRATERCALEVAAATRFPAPHGGEADFAWSFEVPLDTSIREPEGLPDEVVGASLSAQREAIDACGGGLFSVTAYVDTEGQVVAAGAATSDPGSVDKLDCVASAVESMTFENPGSYAAKVQFNVP